VKFSFGAQIVFKKENAVPVLQSAAENGMRMSGA